MGHRAEPHRVNKAAKHNILVLLQLGVRNGKSESNTISELISIHRSYGLSTDVDRECSKLYFAHNDQQL